MPHRKYWLVLGKDLIAFRNYRVVGFLTRLWDRDNRAKVAENSVIRGIVGHRDFSC
jgi:hypothetical protein